MIYATKTPQKIYAEILQDIKTATGVQVLPDDILSCLARNFSYQFAALYAYQNYIAQQSVPYTSTGADLEAWAGMIGVTRKSPTAATTSVIFTGTTGLTVPAGTQLVRSDGFVYTTDSLATVGTAVSITASTYGSAGNNANSIMLTMQNSIAGINNTVATLGANTTASDQETDSSLFNRMLARFQSKVMGGTPTDHVAWALAVESVTQAWCADVPMAGNSVVVWVMLDRTNSTGGYPQGTNGTATSETRFTNATGDQLTVANAMFANKPIGEIMVIASPISTPINFTISGMQSASAATQSAISSAITELFHTAGTPLGTVVTIPSIIQAIEVAAGTTNFSLVTPTASVSLSTGALPELGTLTFQ